LPGFSHDPLLCPFDMQHGSQKWSPGVHDNPSQFGFDASLGVIIGAPLTGSAMINSVTRNKFT